MNNNLLTTPGNELATRFPLRQALVYLTSRIAQALLVLWAAFSVSFLILYALPSDPVSIMLNQQGEPSAVDQLQINALRAEYHLDQPLPVQYGIALWKAVHLDFGRSIQSGEPVVQSLSQALPATAALTFLALGFAMLAGIALALAANLVKRDWLRNALLGIPSVAVSFSWHWFPAMGNQGFSALVLPALTLAIPTAAVIAQVLTRSLQSVRAQPFVEVLIAKGLSPSRLLFVHLLHNAAIPLLSLSGVIVGNLLAGSVVTETVFSREGVGRLAQGAVSGQDIPLVQGVVVLAALIFIGVNLLVDLLYPLLDPRMHGGAGK
jgi:peptide/nickel transport system permease protein